jgi:hypothetical protein
MWDVIKKYSRACEQENYTDEFKARLALGLVEGNGMQWDWDEEPDVKMEKTDYTHPQKR